MKTLIIISHLRVLMEKNRYRCIIINGLNNIDS